MKSLRGVLEAIIAEHFPQLKDHFDSTNTIKSYLVVFKAIIEMLCTETSINEEMTLHTYKLLVKSIEQCCSIGLCAYISSDLVILNPGRVDYIAHSKQLALKCHANCQ